MDNTDIYTIHQGSRPLLVSLPHDGSLIPEAILERMLPSARRAPDTDWHVARLYDFAREVGASVIVPRYSRYVVDLNRPEDDVSLYPGQNTTGLCPAVQFSGEPVYLPNNEPDAAEVAARVEQYWRPYHNALAGELARMKAGHGSAVLWEGHSIRSTCPFLFEGRLPDLNLGTAAGASCSPALTQRLIAVLERQDRYTHVVNGRFKGGYITRHYGQPDNGIDAIQLELAQLNYMDEDSFIYDERKAAELQAVLQALLAAVLD